MNVFYCFIVLLFNCFTFVPAVESSKGSDIDLVYTSNNRQLHATILSYSEIENWFRNNPEKVEALKNGTLPVEQAPAGWDPSLSMQYATEIAVLTIINERDNKGWSEIEIAALAYWNVMNGKLHFMLDIAGIVPVVGEIADLVNGAWYYVEGEKTEAALCLASSVPFVGWFSTGAKCIVKVVKLGDNSYTMLRLSKNAKGLIEFGSPNQLAKVLKTTGTDLHAHHIVPWALKENSVVQKAATAGFHLNDAVNGIALKKYSKVLEEGIHANHPAYNKFIRWRLQNFGNNKNLVPEDAAKFLNEELLPEIRKHIKLCETKNMALNNYFKEINKKLRVR